MHLALKYGAATTSHLVVLVHRADRLLLSPRVELSTAGWGGGQNSKILTKKFKPYVDKNMSAAHVKKVQYVKKKS